LLGAQLAADQQRRTDEQGRQNFPMHYFLPDCCRRTPASHESPVRTLKQLPLVTL
jgi:hypothetical protein